MNKKYITVLLLSLCTIITAGCKKAQIKDVNVQNIQVPDVSLDFIPTEKIKAEGWLLNQLKMQKENITGQFENISPDVLTTGDKKSGWLGGSGESWERGPYYVRGLILLANTLDDNDLKEKARKWIDSFIGSQTASGAAGPYADKPQFDWWPLMPMLIATEEYYDATQDERVIPFLDKYFRYQYTELDKNPLRDWGMARAGDNILAVKWLYDRTKEPYLLDLCKKLYTKAYDWKTDYENGSWAHIVNTHQSFKLFPLMYEITGEEIYKDTYYKGIENLFMTSGRIDGMSNGDEMSGDIGSTHGTETCAVAEQMFSDAIAFKCLKDPLIADHLERVAYNAWPSQLTPEITGQVYFTMQNQIEATLGNHGFTSDGGDRSVYGTPGGYPCCIHNFHMGWPEFVSNLWLKTSDNGLIVSAYAPCSVSTVVGNNTKVTLKETTNYPFEDTVNIKIESDKKDKYPIYVRIPSWCDNSKIYINNQLVASGSAQSYVRLETEWCPGDIIKIVLPMELKTVFMENNSISLSYGALVYALSIKENVTKIDYVSNGWNVTGKFSSYDITPGSDWNYALEVDFKNIEDCFKVKRVKDYNYNKLEFSYDKSPISITCKGSVIDDWEYDDNIKGAGKLPVSPVNKQTNTDNITLIPYSFARLRISLMPWYSKDGETVINYVPAKRSDNEPMFNTVITPTDTSDPFVRKGAIPIKEYTGMFTYNTDKDTVVSLYVNNIFFKELTLKKEENSFNCPLTLKHSRYNKIELKGDLGSTNINNLTVSDYGEAKEYVWEAEKTTILGKALNKGNHVGGIDNTGDGIEFSIDIAESDNYTFRILYSASNGNSTQDIFVDGKKADTVIYPKTDSGWGTFSEDIYTEVTVNLTQGSHKIAFQKTSSSVGFAEIDAIIFKLN